MRSPRPADVVLGAQVAATAALGWPGSARWRLPAGLQMVAAVLLAAGSTLAVAGATQQGTRLRPGVEPPEGVALITRGAYGVSRNPIYTGLLVAGAGFAILRRRPEPLAALAALAVVLHVKTGMEEDRLRQRFGAAYEGYAARTPRLLGLPGGAGGRRQGRHAR